MKLKDPLPGVMLLHRRWSRNQRLPAAGGRERAQGEPPVNSKAPSAALPPLRPRALLPLPGWLCETASWAPPPTSFPRGSPGQRRCPGPAPGRSPRPARPLAVSHSAFQAGSGSATPLASAGAHANYRTRSCLPIGHLRRICKWALEAAHAALSHGDSGAGKAGGGAAPGAGSPKGLGARVAPLLQQGHPSGSQDACWSTKRLICQRSDCI